MHISDITLHKVATLFHEHKNVPVPFFELGVNVEVRSLYSKKAPLKALTDHLGGGSRVDSFDPQW
jgi:hypothetical protein